MSFKDAAFTVIFLLCAASLHGQETRATVSGTLLDPSGAAVPNASVTATEIRTGVKIVTVSDTTGNYNIPFLAPGEYELAADAPGFGHFVRRGIVLASGDHPILDIKLNVGQSSETVNVSAELPLIDVANSATVQSITTKQVEDMPLNGRNPMMIAQLAIGVIATGQPTLV